MFLTQQPLLPLNGSLLCSESQVFWEESAFDYASLTPSASTKRHELPLQASLQPARPTSDTFGLQTSIILIEFVYTVSWVWGFCFVLKKSSFLPPAVSGSAVLD